MHCRLALIAGCLLGSGSSIATEAVETTVTNPGVVLAAGIEGFRVDQPVPDLLQKIGSMLKAAGTEELRVTAVAQHAGLADPAARAASSQRQINLTEFIRGREVRQSFVIFNLDIETKEVTRLAARFLPDRGLVHEPQLTAAQAREKVAARIRKDTGVEVAPGWREKIALTDTPAPRLVYDIEQPSGSRPASGMLVWVFGAKGVDHFQLYEVSASAATGEIIAVQGLLTN
jgi:hypothetical protein